MNASFLFQSCPHLHLRTLTIIDLVIPEPVQKVQYEAESFQWLIRHKTGDECEESPTSQDARLFINAILKAAHICALEPPACAVIHTARRTQPSGLHESRQMTAGCCQSYQALQTTADAICRCVVNFHPTQLCCGLVQVSHQRDSGF